MCDVAVVLMLEEARRQAQMLALAAVVGGAEFTDPVKELQEELAAEPAERPDSDLRRALGLQT